ncbi:conserved hypothetical protein [Xenorhabdus bovienii str. puntauvense]|uniref:Uncharacterized protein n=1 Tax=Xenorhabdus bovienii str. puntauvense TaxID=1398201 RepID=A0A077ND01_XENBV|nr:hypothetical protein [Xenorhabdus bovienii]CDG95805.1 conserved hypothetical protein [Xenorhabdus bovienii str. puntauvense]
MERCKECKGYYGEPKPVAVGEKCCFTLTTGNGLSINYRAVTGKLFLIKNDGYSVTYRKKVYHVDTIAHPDDPYPLTLAFIGRCTCTAK